MSGTRDSLDEGIWSIGKVPAAGMTSLFEKDGPHVRHRRQSFGRWFQATGWRHVVGVLALFFALFPVWFVVLAAFSPSASLSNQRLWPETFTLRQYRTLVDNYPYWQWFWNSLVISIVTAGSTVLLAASAAFAFSRLRFKGRRPGLFSLLLIQMFPASLAFVAIYIMIQSMTSTFDNLGSGSMATIILFYLGGALGANAWLIKGFFGTIPFSLDESAKIDGATHAQIFWKIILPLAAPVLAIIFLLSFISSQAEFLLASVILFGQDISSPSQTVATGLRGLLAGDRYDLRWGPFAVGALIASLPVVLLFQFLQRYIVGGITAGAVKG
jgi:arabinogalactan oligomer/maltooligosaccharide transport system permease protein